MVADPIILINLVAKLYQISSKEVSHHKCLCQVVGFQFKEAFRWCHLWVLIWMYSLLYMDNHRCNKANLQMINKLKPKTQNKVRILRNHLRRLRYYRVAQNYPKIYVKFISLSPFFTASIDHSAKNVFLSFWKKNRRLQREKVAAHFHLRIVHLTKIKWKTLRRCLASILWHLMLFSQKKIWSIAASRRLKISN